MATIRPITRNFPASKDLWEEANLPLCLVVTPHHTDDDDDDDEKAKEQSTKMCNVWKCLQCGAPQPTGCNTSNTCVTYPDTNQFLCWLCGTLSSADIKDQQKGRPEEELNANSFPTLDKKKSKKSKKEEAKKDNDETEQTIVVELPMTRILGEQPDVDDDWTVPAMTCPPIWWVVLDASMTDSAAYWKTCAGVLEDALQDVPSYVHVGIVAASSTHLYSADLTSTAVPHVMTYPLTANEMELSLLPMLPKYVTNVENLLDVLPTLMSEEGLFSSSTNEDDEENKEESGMALSNTIELLLEFMQEAVHPGEDLDEEDAGKNSAGDDDEDDALPKLQYAGGKILCLLGQAPLEIRPKANDEAEQPHPGAGGIGGACGSSAANVKDKWNADLFADQDDVIKDPKQKKDAFPRDVSDMTPERLISLVHPLDPKEDLFAELGERCATFALGVDVIVVIPDGDEYDDEEEDEQPKTANKKKNDSEAACSWFGLPLLRVLSDFSGAPGPLVLSTKANPMALAKHVMARTPWQPGMTFGNEMKLRISPGFDMEDTPVEVKRRQKLQLASFLSTGGVAGPAVSSETNLWILGSCDPFTSLTMDLEVSKRKLPDTFKGADGELVEYQHAVVQICTMYTALEPQEDGSMHTARKMKIASVSLEMTEETEPLFDELDLEALAAVLYRKLELSAVQDGLYDAQDTASGWLQALLVRVYQSAIIEQTRLEELKEAGDKESKEAIALSKFVAKERLIEDDDEEEGKKKKKSKKASLSSNEKLLGLGHEKIAMIPSIVYGLMQCDALRPTCGGHRPSMDARAAAMAQMGSMTPATISQCISPMLEAWYTDSAGKDVVDSVDLNRESVVDAANEMKENGVFYLQSPQRILTFRSDRAQRKIPSKGWTRRAEIALPEALANTIQDACRSYRTAPTIFNAMKDAPTETAQKEGADILDCQLIEAKPTVDGAKSIEEWKSTIVEQVKEELSTAGHL